jgi:hypothetical protein
MAIPTSATWNLADFDETSMAVLLGLGASDLSINPSIAPYFTYAPESNLLRMESSDGVLATADFNVAVPSRYTVEITVRFPQLPDDVGDVAEHRLGMTLADDASRGVSIYFSKNGLAVSRIDDFGSVVPLPDTADSVREVDTFFRTYRIAVDGGLGRAYVFTGAATDAFLPLQFIIPVEATPGSVLDTFQLFVKGSATDPATAEITALRLASDLIIGNFPPTANAGPDRVVPVGQAARLDGRSSFDVEGAQISYAWRAIDAPFGSQYAHDNSSGGTVDDGDADGFTDTLSFVSGSLPSWVTAGDVLVIQETRHVIDTVDNPGGTLTVVGDTLLDSYVSVPFRVVRQSVLVGGDTESPHVVPDIQGLYRFELIVNDGEADSEASEVLVSVVGSRAPFGVEPSIEFLWDALGDEWKFVEGRSVFQEFWRGTAQLLGGKLLEAWQYHYNFNIGDTQRVFQRKWLAYRTLITETAPDDATISPRYGALLASHDFTGGNPSVTGKTLVIEYADDDSPTDTADVTVTFTADDLTTILNEINAALVGTSVSAFSFGTSRFYEAQDGSTADDGDADGVTSVFRYAPGALPSWVAPGDSLVLGSDRYEILTAGLDSYSAVADGNTVDDGDADGFTDTLSFTPASLPGWVAAGDTLVIGGVRYVISSINNPGGSLTVLTDTIPDSLVNVDFQIGGVLTVTENGTTAADILPDNLIEGFKYSIYGVGAVGLRSATRAFRVLSSSTAATDLGLTTDTYNYLKGTEGALVTKRTYRAEPGMDLVFQGVQRGDLFVINNGQAFVVDRVLDDPSDPFPNQRLLLTENLPLDATPEWDVPSVVVSDEVDYETEGSYPGDLVKVEIFDTENSTTTDALGTVIAQRGTQLAASLDDLFSALLDTTRYELRLVGVKRRKALRVDSEVRSIPQLQDKIAQVADPTLWKENVDYYLEPFYRETDESPITMLQFRDSTFIEPDLEPPDILWAELTIFSNELNTQNLFGRLTGFLREDAALFGEDFSYTSAVAGLLYAYQRGPAVNIIKIGAQILFGQPFAEVKGTITEIRDDFTPTTGRVLIQDDDGYDPPRSEVVRSYVYTKDPLDLTAVSGLEINPATGVAYAVGDTIEQFAPIGSGVDIIDYINDPDWYYPFVRSGLMTELEKFFSFVVEFNLDLVNIVGLILAQQFILNVRPTYTHPILLGVKNLQEDVDIVDVLDMTLTMHLFDSFCDTGYSYIYDDYRGDGTIWSSYDDGVTFYDGIVDCVSDQIELCLLMTWVDYAAEIEGTADISTATYPGDFSGRTLDLNVDGTVYSTTFTGASVSPATMIGEINAVLGVNGTASLGGQAASGEITVVKGSLLVDGTDTFDLDDGVNPAVTFEFDDNASVVETPTLRAVNFTSGDTIQTIRDAVVAAINAAPTLDITASPYDTNMVRLVNDAPGTAGNVAIVETVADAGFLVTGMLGGTDALVVTSATVGVNSYVEVEQSTTAALFTVFGFTLGSAYNARIIGTQDLTLATYPGDFSGNTLEVIIDAGPPVNVVFSGGVASPTDLRDEINAAVGSTVAAIDSLNRLVLFSNTTGVTSEVEVGAATTASLLTVFGVTASSPVNGDIYTTRSNGNVVTNNANIFYDTLVEEGTISGSPPVFTPSGITFFPTFDLPLLAGDYRVCVEIDSGNDVLP